jgi:enamine deaminase RidA (YjgF/YER057c/UK114 family)
MGNVDQRLAELGIVLPEAPKPVAAYVPAKRAGNLVFVSGQLPFVGGKLPAAGTVPSVVPLDTAVNMARQCVLNGLAAAKGLLGSLDEVVSVVRVGCFVASDAGFGDQPKVANGASELLVQVFGEAGRHSRAAVGCPVLPLNAAVEVEMVLEVADRG